ncbi:hypothetical protein M441DRAFT_88853 [Trichoderma asperellum CBS 433.97]|uniref:Nitrogen regulatory protein areA GATA-like domain-containing protein n=1 Tax=Trichoderma asperellum (strain ATCC 204424 / CBS 433.97 / NBRC 101777) TaxID=1042311 RepID=A0A2T3ZCA1_TRIA4|nr:hypothetical protein M441DRAFT_88853 [Trichoderma asperellum CBS 433.97]PTB42435.1 hypothetical protein M441DRAFT_88853 [Trichoderma asperellum CBS 433.97]
MCHSNPHFVQNGLGFEEYEAGFWSHIMVAVPLLVAILTLWPTFTGTADAKKATELAKWTAIKDFIEFCQSRRRVLSTPLLSVLDSLNTAQILQPTSIAHSTGLEVTDHAPRRRLVGSDSERWLHSVSLDSCDRTEDDNGITLQPERQVDYLSHVWQEADLHQSWRHVQSQKTNYENAARLENAAWRSWTKFRNNLPTILPNVIKWSKDDDITWLYGPLQLRTTGLYALKSNASREKQEIIQKGELTKRDATLQAEEDDQYETVCGQLGLDGAATQISRQTFQQAGNLKHGRYFGGSFNRNISIQAGPKEVRFKEEFE